MKFITKLYQHQINCVNKLKHIKVGALFMEQGTGKTRTMLELINIRLEKGRIDHVIWLCPCSCKENLRRDIIKHTGNDQKGFITICGIETLSTSIKWNSSLIDMSEKHSCYLIVDESSKVKNHKAKRTQNILRIAEKCKYKCILNGTPITRNEADLFSQMYLLDWRILGYKGFWSFAANHLEYDEYGNVRKCLNTDYLTEKIAPYSYQVKKSECLDLPKKTYDIKYFNLSSDQDKHYKEVADKLLFLVDEFKPETIYSFLTGLQLVLCGYRVNIVHSKKKYVKKMLNGEHRLIEREGDYIIKERFFSNYKDNPRIQCLENVLEGVTEKCIIFCKYSDEITDICNLLGDKAVRFDGSLNLKNRQKSIDQFASDKQFLVANKTCAGYGLNLQFCSYVIFYSNDYDFGTRAQAEDRVYRIGQNKNVNIIDICASYTLDEKIIDCINRKENLLNSFKHELETKKDKEELTASYIYKKDYRGKRYSKKMKTLKKEDLIEN